MSENPSSWCSLSGPGAEARPPATSLSAPCPVVSLGQEPFPYALTSLTSSSFPDLFPLHSRVDDLATAARQKLQQLRQLELHQRQQQLSDQLLFLGEQQQQAENHLREEESALRIGSVPCTRPPADPASPADPTGEREVPQSDDGPGLSRARLGVAAGTTLLQHWAGGTKASRKSFSAVWQDNAPDLGVPSGTAGSPRPDRDRRTAPTKTCMQGECRENGTREDSSVVPPPLALSADSLTLSQLRDSSALLDASVGSLPQSHPQQRPPDCQPSPAVLKKDPLPGCPPDAALQGPSRSPTLLQCEWGPSSSAVSSATRAAPVPNAVKNCKDGKNTRRRAASSVKSEDPLSRELPVLYRANHSVKDEPVPGQVRAASARSNSAATATAAVPPSVVFEVSARSVEVDAKGDGERVVRARRPSTDKPSIVPVHRHMTQQLRLRERKQQERLQQLRQHQQKKFQPSHRERTPARTLPQQGMKEKDQRSSSADQVKILGRYVSFCRSGSGTGSGAQSRGSARSGDKSSLRAKACPVSAAARPGEDGHRRQRNPETLYLTNKLAPVGYETTESSCTDREDCRLSEQVSRQDHAAGNASRKSGPRLPTVFRRGPCVASLREETSPAGAELPRHGLHHSQAVPTSRASSPGEEAAVSPSPRSEAAWRKEKQSALQSDSTGRPFPGGSDTSDRRRSVVTLVADAPKAGQATPDEFTEFLSVSGSPLGGQPQRTTDRTPPPCSAGHSRERASSASTVKLNRVSGASQKTAGVPAVRGSVPRSRRPPPVSSLVAAKACTGLAGASSPESGCSARVVAHHQKLFSRHRERTLPSPPKSSDRQSRNAALRERAGERRTKGASRSKQSSRGSLPASASPPTCDAGDRDKKEREPESDQPARALGFHVEQPSAGRLEPRVVAEVVAVRRVPGRMQAALKGSTLQKNRSATRSSRINTSSLRPITSSPAAARPPGLRASSTRSASLREQQATERETENSRRPSLVGGGGSPHRGKDDTNQEFSFSAADEGIVLKEKQWTIRTESPEFVEPRAVLGEAPSGLLMAEGRPQDSVKYQDAEDKLRKVLEKLRLRLLNKESNDRSGTESETSGSRTCSPAGRTPERGQSFSGIGLPSKGDREALPMQKSEGTPSEWSELGGEGLASCSLWERKREIPPEEGFHTEAGARQAPAPTSGPGSVDERPGSLHRRFAGYRRRRSRDSSDFLLQQHTGANDSKLFGSRSGRKTGKQGRQRTPLRTQGGEGTTLGAGRRKTARPETTDSASVVRTLVHLLRGEGKRTRKSQGREPRGCLGAEQSRCRAQGHYRKDLSVSGSPASRGSRSLERQWVREPRTHASLESLSRCSSPPSVSSSRGSATSRTSSSPSLRRSSSPSCRGLPCSMQESVSGSTNSSTGTSSAPSLITKWLRYSAAILQSNRPAPRNAPHVCRCPPQVDEQFGFTSDLLSASAPFFPREQLLRSISRESRPLERIKSRKRDGLFTQRSIDKDLNQLTSSSLDENCRGQRKGRVRDFFLPTYVSEDGDVDAVLLSGDSGSRQRSKLTFYDPLLEDPEEVVRRIKIRLGMPVSPRADREEDGQLSFGTADDLRWGGRRGRHGEASGERLPDPVEPGTSVSSLASSTFEEGTVSITKYTPSPRGLPPSHTGCLPSSLSLSSSSVCLSPPGGAGQAIKPAEGVKRSSSQQGLRSRDDAAQKKVSASPVFAMSVKGLATNAQTVCSDRQSVGVRGSALLCPVIGTRESQGEPGAAGSRSYSSRATATAASRLRHDASPHSDGGPSSVSERKEVRRSVGVGQNLAKPDSADCDGEEPHEESPLQFLSSFLSEDGLPSSEEGQGNKETQAVVKDASSSTGDHGHVIHRWRADSLSQASPSVSPVILSTVVRGGSSLDGDADAGAAVTEKEEIFTYRKLANESQGPLSMSELLHSPSESTTEPATRTEGPRLDAMVSDDRQGANGRGPGLTAQPSIVDGVRVAGGKTADASERSSGLHGEKLEEGASCAQGGLRERKDSSPGICDPAKAEPKSDVPANNEGTSCGRSHGGLEAGRQGDRCGDAGRCALGPSSVTSQPKQTEGETEPRLGNEEKPPLPLPAPGEGLPGGGKEVPSSSTERNVEAPEAGSQDRVMERQVLHCAALADSLGCLESQAQIKLRTTVGMTYVGGMPFSEEPQCIEETAQPERQPMNECLTVSAQLEEIQQLQVLLADEGEVDFAEQPTERAKRGNFLIEPNEEQQRDSSRLGQWRNDKPRREEAGSDLEKTQDGRSRYATPRKQGDSTASHCQTEDAATQVSGSPEALKEMRRSEMRAGVSAVADESSLQRHRQEVTLLETRGKTSAGSSPRACFSPQLEPCIAEETSLCGEKYTAKKADSCSPGSVGSRPRECVGGQVLDGKDKQLENPEETRLCLSPGKKPTSQEEVGAAGEKAGVAKMKKSPVENCSSQQSPLREQDPQTCGTRGDVTLPREGSHGQAHLPSGGSSDGKPSAAATLSALQTKTYVRDGARLPTQNASTPDGADDSSGSSESSAVRLAALSWSPRPVTEAPRRSSGHGDDPMRLSSRPDEEDVAVLDTVAASTGTPPADDPQNKDRCPGLTEDAEHCGRRGREQSPAEDKSLCGELLPGSEGGSTRQNKSVCRLTETEMTTSQVEPLAEERAFERESKGRHADLPSAGHPQVSCSPQTDRDCFCVSFDMSPWLVVPPPLLPFLSPSESNRAEAARRVGTQKPSPGEVDESWSGISWTLTAGLPGADVEQAAVPRLFLSLRQVDTQQEGRRYVSSLPLVAGGVSRGGHECPPGDREQAFSRLCHKGIQNGFSADARGREDVLDPGHVALPACCVVQRNALLEQLLPHQRQGPCLKREEGEQDTESGHPAKAKPVEFEAALGPVSQSRGRQGLVFPVREKLSHGGVQSDRAASSPGQVKPRPNSGVALLDQGKEGKIRRDLLREQAPQAVRSCLMIRTPGGNEANEEQRGHREKRDGAARGPPLGREEEEIRSLSGVSLGNQRQVADGSAKEANIEEGEQGFSGTVEQSRLPRRDPGDGFLFVTRGDIETMTNQPEDSWERGTMRIPGQESGRIEEHVLAPSEEGRRDSDMFLFSGRPGTERESSEKMWREWGEEAYLDQKRELYAAVARELRGRDEASTEDTLDFDQLLRNCSVPSQLHL